MLRIAICDDKPDVVEYIYHSVIKAMQQLGENSKVYRYTNGLDILNSNIKFNLIFLDIEMPSINGIDLAERLRKTDRNIQIVFVTNHQEYMQRAYKIHAFDYITKPVDEESIALVLNDYIKSVCEHLTDTREFECTNGNIVFINVKDIIYISCGPKKRTVILITAKGDYICKGEITKIYNGLNTLDFFMPHRSHIINLSMVAAYKPDGKILMNNDDYIPLSENKALVFEKTLARKQYTVLNK